MTLKVKTNLGELQEIVNNQVLKKYKRQESWDKTFELSIHPTENGWEIIK